MTKEELKQIPLYSTVHVNFWTRNQVFDGYIIEKYENYATVYRHLEPIHSYLEVNVMPYMTVENLTLIEKYTPQIITRPPYNIYTLPLFSTVIVPSVANMPNAIGVVVEKDFDNDAVFVFFPQDQSLMRLTSNYYLFSGPPPGVNYQGEIEIPIEYPDDQIDIPIEYPDVMDEPGPKTSPLLIAAGLILIKLIW